MDAVKDRSSAADGNVLPGIVFGEHYCRVASKRPVHTGGSTTAILWLVVDDEERKPISRIRKEEMGSIGCKHGRRSVEGCAVWRSVLVIACC